MATLLAEITVIEGKVSEFEAVVRDLYDATHREESGVVAYQYWRGSEPNSYYVLLAFESYRAFIAHQASDHHEDAAPKLRDLTEFIDLEWLDPVQGASPDRRLPQSNTAPMSSAEKIATEKHPASSPAWWSI